MVVRCLCFPLAVPGLVEWHTTLRFEQSGVLTMMVGADEFLNNDTFPDLEDEADELEEMGAPVILNDILVWYYRGTTIFMYAEKGALERVLVLAPEPDEGCWRWSADYEGLVPKWAAARYTTMGRGDPIRRSI